MEIKLIDDMAPALKWVDNGLAIPADTSKDEVAAILKNFSFWQNASAVALADVLAFASSKGYLDQLELVFAECGLTPTDVSRALAISDVPRGLRSEKLSAEHYFVVARMTMDQQTKWLAAAEKNSLSALELKRSIEAGRVLTKEEIAELSGKGSGIVNYHGIVNQWGRWSSKVGGVQGITAWPTPVLRQWLADVSPIVEAVEAAKAALNDRK
jgi:hypothetical protein